jgi:hypothetical protein
MRPLPCGSSLPKRIITTETQIRRALGAAHY